MTVLLTLLTILTAAASIGEAATLKVMKQGLGNGAITADPATPGINCGADCDETYSPAVLSVRLTATPLGGSTFAGWRGPCSGTGTCLVPLGADQTVRAEFVPGPTEVINPITDVSPVGLAAYLSNPANNAVNTPARFIAALPADYKQNWILMSRSESLQTGTAEIPRILMPNADARFVFSFGLKEHGSFPGASPNAIEYMQWDAAQKNFRFHEIVLASIGEMGAVPARTRQVYADDVKCSKCHSTRNVLNLDRAASTPAAPVPGATNGTDGIPPGIVQVKNKPNWDAYDSWGGMLPFNRDRIYQGTIEEIAFRRIFNLWNWRGTGANDGVRQFLEQLQLQPPHVGAASPHRIVRNADAATDAGHITFGFDGQPPLPTAPRDVNYRFDGVARTPGTDETSVPQMGRYVTLRHSNPRIPPTNDDFSDPGSDEGRGVRFFDLLGGFGTGVTEPGINILTSNLNAQRIADEIVNHRYATGSVPVDVRPLALAITKQVPCIVVNAGSGAAISNPDISPALPALGNLAFFTSRNGMNPNQLITSTRLRADNLPRRKADIQKMNLDRLNRDGTRDPYLVAAEQGLIQRYGGTPVDISLPRIRRDVFQRPNDLGHLDEVTGDYVDREDHGSNTERIALYRYFLEPLGVSVDKWSMGVRGRSRSYTFADVFSTYLNTFEPILEKSLTDDPRALSLPDFDCPALIGAINGMLPSLPGELDVPKYTDVQRIFNKSCIECHGGLDYPPAHVVSYLDLSEDEEAPVAGDPQRALRMQRPHGIAAASAAQILQRIRLPDSPNEVCPSQPGPPFVLAKMPCGGPPLSKVDIETIERWVDGGSLYSEGDPHLRTIDGVYYDFQGAGEYVLLRGENLEIQARMIPVSTAGPLGPDGHTGLTSCVSVNGAIAVSLDGQRITYQPRLDGEPDKEGLHLHIDGKPVKLENDEIRLSSGGRIVRSPAQGGIVIESQGGTAVIVTPSFWDHHQIWYMNVNVRRGRATEGLLGSIAPNEWLPAMPDGSFLGSRPADLNDRYSVMYEKFGNAWRVDDASSLFDYAPGQSTKYFTDEAWPNGDSPKSCLARQLPGGVKPQPPLEPIDKETAAQLCAEIKDKVRQANCMQDVMVTGEKAIAQLYATTETIERNRAPDAPRLTAPGNFAARAGDELAFRWNTTRGRDKDNHGVTYRLCFWRVDEAFGFDKCETEPMKPEDSQRSFRLTKNKIAAGKDYFWKVIAEDALGGISESETRRVTIK
ncbi:MAG: hypothetical protein HC855_09640 [Rhizobiales bacterium]|nr:hypothetical protein [Hyphomicrobiales bacterium]